MISQAPLQFHPPENWQDFERLTRILFEDLYDARFNRFGRSGQNQKGIDIFGKLNQKNIVIQCKCKNQLTNSKNITIKEITDIVTKIDNEYSTHIDEIYILVTLPDDVKTQEFIANLNLDRGKKNQAEIIFWGWNEISDRINASRKAREFFQIKSATSIIKITAILGIIAAIVYSTYILWDQYENKSLNKKKANQETKIYLKETYEIAKNLERSYQQCLNTMTMHLFLTSHQLTQNCVTPISTDTLKLSQLNDRFSSSVDSTVYEQINILMKYLENQPPEIYATTQITKNIEKQIVNELLFSCPKNLDTDNNSELLKKELKTSFNFQMYSYFLTRDFILPIIQSIKSNISIIERNVNNDTVPKNLITEASKLNSLITLKSNYKFNEFPISLSKVKHLTSRDAKFEQHENEITKMIEEHNLGSIYQLSTMIGLYNNPIIVDRLIECGAMQPGTKQHFKNEMKLADLKLPLQIDQF